MEDIGNIGPKASETDEWIQCTYWIWKLGEISDVLNSRLDTDKEQLMSGGPLLGTLPGGRRKKE